MTTGEEIVSHKLYSNYTERDYGKVVFKNVKTDYGEEIIAIFYNPDGTEWDIIEYEEILSKEQINKEIEKIEEGIAEDEYCYDHDL